MNWQIKEYHLSLFGIALTLLISKPRIFGHMGQISETGDFARPTSNHGLAKHAESQETPTIKLVSRTPIKRPSTSSNWPQGSFRGNVLSLYISFLTRNFQVISFPGPSSPRRLLLLNLYITFTWLAGRQASEWPVQLSNILFYSANELRNLE